MEGKVRTYKRRMNWSETMKGSGRQMTTTKRKQMKEMEGREGREGRDDGKGSSRLARRWWS